MIEMLEKQLSERKEALAQLQKEIATAKGALNQLKSLEGEMMHQ